MKSTEIWNKVKNDPSKVYNEPIFDVFLKVTDTIRKDDYVTLTQDQKKLLKPVVRLKMAASTFNKSEQDIIDSAIEDANNNIETKAIVIRMLRDAVNHGNIDLISYILTSQKIRAYFVNKTNKDEIQKIGLHRIVSNILGSAIGDNELKVVKYLVEKDYLNYLDDVDILNAFSSSIGKGRMKIVEYLFFEVISKRPQIDERNIKEKAIEYPDLHNAMKTAAHFGYLDTIKFLIKNGFFTEKILPFIAKEGDLELTQSIVEKMNKKNPEAQGFLNDSFGMAALNNHVDVLKYLHGVIKQVVGPYWVGYKKALNIAAENNNFDAIKYIVENLPIEFEDLKNVLSYNDLRGPRAKKIAEYINSKMEELSKNN